MEYELVKIKVKSIKKKNTIRKGILYDLHVEDDNSYVAGKIVVHNSRPQPFIRPTFRDDLPKIIFENAKRHLKWLLTLGK